MGGDLHPVLVSMRQSQLECPKETGGPRDGGSHESKLTKQPLPFLDANLPLVVEVLEDGENATFSLVREFQSSLRGVQDPSKDLLALAPSAFAFQELFLRDGFLSLCCREVRLRESIIHCMHDATADIFAPALGTLRNTDKVVHKDIHMCDGSSVFHERDTIFRLRQRQCELCELRESGSSVRSVVLRLWRQQHRC